MKILIVISFPLAISLLACHNKSSKNKKIETAGMKADSGRSKVASFSSHPIPSLDVLFRDSGSVNFTDNGSFWLLNFREGKVCFEFNPSCEYCFPVRVENNKMLFFWIEDMNCNFNRGLDAKFQGIRSPSKGDLFGEIYRINDSIIYVKYFFVDWVKMINEKEKSTIDTLFPSVFRSLTL